MYATHASLKLAIAIATAATLLHVVPVPHGAAATASSALVPRAIPVGMGYWAPSGVNGAFDVINSHVEKEDIHIRANISFELVYKHREINKTQLANVQACGPYPGCVGVASAKNQSGGAEDVDEGYKDLVEKIVEMFQASQKAKDAQDAAGKANGSGGSRSSNSNSNGE